MKRSFKGSVAVVLLAGAGLAMTLPVLAQTAPDAGAPAAGAPAQGAGGPMMGRMGGGFDFTRFDADGDGKVTTEEFNATRNAGVAALDADGDGKLTLEELVAHEMRGVQARVEARVKARIAAQDADGDGALSAAELAVRPMPARMFQRLDADGDGAVSTEEVRAMQDRMHKQMRGDDRGRRGDDRGKRGEGWRGHHGHPGMDGHRGMMRGND